MSMFTYEHIPVAPDAFDARATDFIAQIMRDAVEKRGRCIVGLSGGSTPGPVYEALALSPHSDSLPPFDEACAEHSRSAQGKRGERTIDWSKVTFFLVDERYVSASDPQSNQHLVRETLLKGINSFSGLHTSSTDRLCHAERNEPQRVQTKHEHSRSSAQYDTALPLLISPNTELLIEECAKDYEKRLREHLTDGSPDLVILGLGEDGHIASLFPGDIDALLEKERWVLHTRAAGFQYTPVPELRSVRGAAGILKTPHPVERITVTLPLLMTARSMLFLLRGEGKKKIFGETISANADPIEHPAHALLVTGRTTWITGW